MRCVPAALARIREGGNGDPCSGSLEQGWGAILVKVIIEISCADQPEGP